jgi:hypothetical protein
MPFTKKKSLREKLETQLGDLAGQTEELRKQVAERAPGVRDQIVEQTEELRKQVAEKAPVVRDQIVAALPDREQLLSVRDDLFDRLPENVQDKLPEQVKPKRKRLRKVAAVGVLTGAGAAAFAILKRRGDTPTVYTPPTPAAAPKPAPSTSPAASTGAAADTASTSSVPTAEEILDETTTPQHKGPAN